MINDVDLSVEIPGEFQSLIEFLEAGTGEMRELADRWLLKLELTRKQLSQVYGCDAKRVKALSEPDYVKDWGDGCTHYFRLSHAEVADLMRQSQNPCAKWLIDRFTEAWERV